MASLLFLGLLGGARPVPLRCGFGAASAGNFFCSGNSAASLFATGRVAVTLLTLEEHRETQGACDVAM